MNDVVSILVSALPLVALIAIPVLLINAIGPVDLTLLFRAASFDEWPRGVQEEDPRPWQVGTPRSIDQREDGPDPGGGPAFRPGTRGRATQGGAADRPAWEHARGGSGGHLEVL